MPSNVTPIPNQTPRKHLAWWIVLCVIFPVVGLILFLVWRNTSSKAAKACGFSALLSSISQIIYPLLLTLVVFTVNYIGWIRLAVFDPPPKKPFGESTSYMDYADGVVDFTIDTKQDLWYSLFDESTNTLIQCYNKTIVLYDAETRTKKNTFSFINSFLPPSAYNGKLAVGIGEFLKRKIFVFDLSTGEKTEYDTSTSTIDKIFYCGSIVLYLQGSSLYALDLTSGTSTFLKSGLSSLDVSCNPKNGLVYILSRVSNRRSFEVLDPTTMNIRSYDMFKPSDDSSLYSFFDGKYLHTPAGVYDPVTIKKVDSQLFPENINAEKLKLSEVLCYTDEYRLISTLDYKTVVYSNTKNKIICTLDVPASQIYELEENKFFVLCKISAYTAIIDLNRFPFK